MERDKKRTLLPMSLLEVKNLKTWYPVKKGWFKEDGCGKSTLGKTIIRLENPTEGSVIINGKDIAKLTNRELRKERTDFQMIFQDPYGSLNPRMNILQTLDEVLLVHSKLNKSERYKRIVELLSLVGLREEQLTRYPHQFSGGQRQRIGIARALAVEPKLIIADEPVSALDVSVQAQIINLLKEIQEKTQISFLFIAHDLAVVEHISARIMVMYLGKIVESGTSNEVCNTPKHPYTKALLSAVPSLNPEMRKKRIVLEGDVPSPIYPPSGCYFHPRCPNATDICKKTAPFLKAISNNSLHQVSCHHS